MSRVGQCHTHCPRRPAPTPFAEPITAGVTVSALWLPQCGTSHLCYYHWASSLQCCCLCSGVQSLLMSLPLFAEPLTVCDAIADSDAVSTFPIDHKNPTQSPSLISGNHAPCNPDTCSHLPRNILQPFLSTSFWGLLRPTPHHCLHSLSHLRVTTTCFLELDFTAESRHHRMALGQEHRPTC